MLSVGPTVQSAEHTPTHTQMDATESITSSAKAGGNQKHCMIIMSNMMQSDVQIVL